jgi:hypothetical protein
VVYGKLVSDAKGFGMDRNEYLSRIAVMTQAQPSKENLAKAWDYKASLIDRDSTEDIVLLQGRLRCQ